jgi:hypothetical protein
VFNRGKEYGEAVLPKSLLSALGRLKSKPASAMPFALALKGASRTHTVDSRFPAQTILATASGFTVTY